MKRQILAALLAVAFASQAYGTSLFSGVGGTGSSGVDFGAVGEDLLPDGDGTRDFGSASLGWAVVHVSNGTVRSQFTQTSMGTTTDNNFTISRNGTGHTVFGSGALRPNSDGLNDLGTNTTRFGTAYVDIVNLGDDEALTVATGAITVTKSYHRVDTEASASSDDLDTITAAGEEGELLVLRAAANARTVVLKDGTGNLLLAGDFSLDHSDDRITLIYTGSNWAELSRSDNAT